MVTESPKGVLIAHQSTIPHYRVPFYNALERLRPDIWRFDVVFDSSDLQTPLCVRESVGTQRFRFSTLDVETRTVDIGAKAITYQTFWREAGKYDLVIVEHAVNNVTYPLCQLHRVSGVKFAYWGHGEDRSASNPSGLKAVAERLKILLARRAGGFFAYTPGVKAYLESQGLSSDKIFVVNNTVDINRQRDAYTRWRPRRKSIREELGVQRKKVLLFVGRFARRKRLGFLLEAFSVLRTISPDFHLLLVGEGEAKGFNSAPDGVSSLGAILDVDELAPIYVASDVFAYPGAVGLAPLQALCYDLPVVWIEADNHGPEVEYLSPSNSLMLRASTTPADYADAVLGLFEAPSRLHELREGTWMSINHLTIDQMASRFIQGVNAILAQ